LLYEFIDEEQAWHRSGHVGKPKILFLPWRQAGGQAIIWEARDTVNIEPSRQRRSPTADTPRLTWLLPRRCRHPRGRGDLIAPQCGAFFDCTSCARDD
jgi:hypothetical protein